MPKPESQRARKTRAARVLEGLKETYPDARTELEFANPFELLVATILSAQATDKSVNVATPKLFEAYPTAETMASATPEDVEPFIRTIGLYRNKARNIVLTARALVEQFEGQVPNDFEAIQTLPGVGRKTANVVLSNAYGRPGIAVDTHVSRLAKRLGFSVHTDPEDIEHDLEKLFAVDNWIFVHHALILHGRRVCEARKPRCESCSLAADCPRVGV